MKRGCICALLSAAGFAPLAVAQEENEPPVAVCVYVEVYLSDGNGFEVNIIPDDVDGGSFDEDGVIEFMDVGPDIFDCETLGEVVVTLEVYDDEGERDWCEAVVWVYDDIPPDPHCKPVRVTLDENGQATIAVDDVDDGSEDNCVIEVIELSQDAFTCENLGENTVALYLEDGMDNAAMCQTTVTVSDPIPPNVSCKNIEVYLDEHGQATVTPEDIDDGSTDNCAIERLELSQDTFTCDDLGENAVTLTAYDASGNAARCEATVTVVDQTPPAVACKDLVVYLEEDGKAYLPPEFVDDGSTDNCAIDWMALSQDLFSCEDLGENAVTLVVADTSGNVGMCEATITVADEVPPEVSCRNIQVYLDKDGKAYVPTEYVDDGSTDNCGIDRIELSKDLFGCDDLGENSVTLTVYDTSGNAGACEAVVTVEDDLKACGGEGEGEAEGEGESTEEAQGARQARVEAPPREQPECEDIAECAASDGTFNEGDYLCLAVPCPVWPAWAYQWEKDRQTLVDDGRISGACERVLSLRVLQTSDAGEYTCVHEGGIFGPVHVRMVPKHSTSELLGVAGLAGGLVGVIIGIGLGVLMAYRRVRRPR